MDGRIWAVIGMSVLGACGGGPEEAVGPAETTPAVTEAPPEPVQATPAPVDSPAPADAATGAAGGTSSAAAPEGAGPGPTGATPPAPGTAKEGYWHEVAGAPPPTVFKGPPKKSATAQEVQQARRNYHDLIVAVHAAHARIVKTVAGGKGARWPTTGEIQSNKYDLDGDGPGTRFAQVMPAYLDNPLTPSKGQVVDYCNTAVAIGTITNEDTDWHYCPETGRVIPSGGYTAEPIIDWAIEENQIGKDRKVASANGVPPSAPPRIEGMKPAPAAGSPGAGG